MKTLEFTVEIKFRDKIAESDYNLSVVGENIALALKSYANSCGLAPEDSETFTDEISVFVGGNLIAKENMY